MIVVPKGRVTFDSNVSTVKALFRAATPEGLGLATEHLLGEARKEIPLEEATLERSGVASVDAARQIGAVSFNTPYAVKQHQDPTLQHNGGRKYRYLEDPMNRERPTLLRLIWSKIRPVTK